MKIWKLGSTFYTESWNSMGFSNPPNSPAAIGTEKRWHSKRGRGDPLWFEKLAEWIHIYRNGDDLYVKSLNCKRKPCFMLHFICCLLTLDWHTYESNPLILNVIKKSYLHHCWGVSLWFSRHWSYLRQDRAACYRGANHTQSTQMCQEF